MKHIVTKEWLASQLHREDVRIIDCRFYLDDPVRGLKEYVQAHLPGASYFDLEKDLSAKIEKHGGRHPLPMIDEFVEKLSAAGIHSDTTVVVYDDQFGAMAARFWWMLRYLGHEHVYVLDGGFASWKQAGYPLSQDVPIYPRVSFEGNIQSHLLATVEEVREAVQNGGAILIDSRERKRYLGIEEPIDYKAGHIPGARNVFWKEGLTEEGNWKSPEEQKKRFSFLSKEQPVIVYCGSGVTACANALALAEAEFPNVRLYVGSWSDWISYDENPIQTGE
jgi:thiosulfate/3-mercaptopyruvate sulfurtransferase